MPNLYETPFHKFIQIDRPCPFCGEIIQDGGPGDDGEWESDYCSCGTWSGSEFYRTKGTPEEFELERLERENRWREIEAKNQASRNERDREEYERLKAKFESKEANG